MFRGVGDEGEEVEVPPMLFEIEVETEKTSPTEVEEESGSNEMSIHLLDPRSHPHPPPKLPDYRMAAPFKTSKAFGEWLFEVMDIPSFQIASFLFSRYSLQLQMKNLKTLVAFAKCAFRNAQRLYYLEGLFNVANSTKHQYYIERVYRKQLQIYWKHGL